MWADMFVRRSRLREAERQAALLRRHALEDPLTGLGNRRSAERRLGAMRLGVEPLSLAVVDVDRFKSVNDAASHSQGDVVLRRVADLLREHSRTGDEVYRWAGDEFLVVLPTATEAQAVVVMERLRAAVAAADWTDLQLPEPVTVSIGVATAPAVDEGQPATVVGWRALFDSADLNLFSAKRGGRNRVRAPGVEPAAGRRGRRMSASAWGAWDASDEGRRVPEHLLDSVTDDVHSALVPPGALHHRVTAALANWQLDDAEELLAGVERDPSPYVAADPAADAVEGAPVSLGKAWADTLRAELLVRRLRVAGFTLVGEPVAAEVSGEPAARPARGRRRADRRRWVRHGEETDPRSESASRAALAIALVRSAKAAFDASDDDLQRAAGLARHARIELLSRRIDAAMDEAVEAASLLDPMLRAQRPAHRHPRHAGRRPGRPRADAAGAGLPAPRVRDRRHRGRRPRHPRA